MRVLIVGGSGQLGSDLKVVFEESGYETIPLSHSDISVENYESVRNVIECLRPELVIDTAAFHDVEKCEEDPERAFLVNAVGARNISLVCERLGCSVAYISTDYVFDGKKRKPYIEYDSPNPLNVYGKSKVAGENEIVRLTNRYYIIRTAWLYGKKGSRVKKGNFITKVLKLAKENEVIKVVNDQIGTPTNTFYLAKQILEIVKNGIYGIFHATSQGEASWYDFAKEIVEILGLKVKVVPIETKDLSLKAERPRYSVLDNFVLRSLGIDIMPHWREALREFLKGMNL